MGTWLLPWWAWMLVGVLLGLLIWVWSIMRVGDDDR